MYGIPLLMKMAVRGIFVVVLLAAGAAAGWVASRLHLPLAWMIGPLLLIGLATILFRLPSLPTVFRYSGQVVIGGSVGLYLTPVAMDRIISYAFPILLGTVLMTSVACLISLAQIRFSKTDAATAIFSNIPGGPLDMAMMAAQHGGDPARTAAYQTIRIATVVLLFPPVMMLSSTEVFPREAIHGSWLDSLVLVTIGLAAAFGAWKLRVMNPFFIGPLLAVGALTASDAGLSAHHEGVIPAAQVLFGVTLGGMIQRKTFEQAGKFMVSLVLTTITLLVASVLVTELLVLIFGGDFSTVALGNAPAAVAEMVITAQVLLLDVPLVASFQIARVVLGLFLGGLFFALYTRWQGRSAAGNREK
jgi:uncharacterized protein